ncbi:MAG TPA: hypothetical protein VG097_20445, partial [Gemmata sp.]|nr:hypothetical protein [Gemmata sp.]
VRRNKGRVIAASLVLFTLLAGTIGTTLGIVLAKRQEGYVNALAKQLETQPAKSEEWEFPDADRLRASNIGDVFAADYTASKPFEDVWTYYAKKLGFDQKYNSNLTFGSNSFSSDSGRYQIQILNSTNDPGVASARRPTTKSATLIRRGGYGKVTIIISRAKDEEKTYFTLIVEGK